MWDLTRSRSLGGSGGARESQLFWGYVMTRMFSKIHLDIITTIITTNTEGHYVIRIYRFGAELSISLARASLEDTGSLIGARVFTPDSVQN